MRVLVVGGGAREHAIAATLRTARAEVSVASPNSTPGLNEVASVQRRLAVTQADAIVSFAKEQRVHYAVIGPEAALEAGVADALRAADVPVVGPSRSGARIETSKRFCRELLEKYHVEGSPKFEAIANLDEVDARVGGFTGPFVVKPVGLTSGKGVWVQGRDFQTPEEGASYAKKLLASGGAGVLLEEKVEGEEFSLMAFVTDSGIFPMPVAQDYKRALEGDQGGNTGGMGSYSQRDHLVPFLSASHRDQAFAIVRRAVDAMRSEGIPYRGILYGGFMLTSKGPILMEFNARFGDPEAINVLTLYEEGDFAELLYGVAVGRVDPDLVQFRRRATVVKYVVPVGYGANPTAGGIVELDEPKIVDAGVRVFYGSVESDGPGRVRLSTSRGIALAGEASAIHEASDRVNAALAFVRGSYYVRRDIGNRDDLARRVEHVRTLFVPGAKPSPLPLSVAAPDAPPSSAGTAAQVM